jgi:hypothetical protein
MAMDSPWSTRSVLLCVRLEAKEDRGAPAGGGSGKCAGRSAGSRGDVEEPQARHSSEAAWLHSKEFRARIAASPPSDYM